MTSAFKLFSVAIFVINSADNTNIPLYTLPPTQHHSFFGNLPSLYFETAYKSVSKYNWAIHFEFREGKRRGKFFDSKVMLSTNDVWVKKKPCLRWRIASKVKKELPSVVCQIYQLHLFRAAGFTYQISY